MQVGECSPSSGRQWNILTIRIAILGSRGIPARYGGFESFAEQLAVGLAKEGVEVTVFCESGAGAQPDEYRGVKLEYVRAPAFGPLTTILFDVRCLWRARRNHDVVYMLGYGASFMCFLPRLWGKEVWINMDGLEWTRSKWSFLGRSYLKMMEAFAMWTPNRLIADAEAIRTHLLARYRRVPQCSVIPYGAPIVDSDPGSSSLAAHGVEPGGYYLVVCRLEPENHVVEIVDGVMASGTDLPLLIVGNPIEGSSYADQLKQYGECSRIRFVGAIYDQDELIALRFHARAYLHGHSVGGTNPSLLEAMACGNFIIAHDNPFNREVAGSSALYFADSTELAERVRALESNDERRREGGEEARRRVRRKYAPERVVGDYLQLINEVVGSKRG
jgi:glycosyltransferase involved in cell wall biosynthesis